MDICVPCFSPDAVIVVMFLEIENNMQEFAPCASQVAAKCITLLVSILRSCSVNLVAYGLDGIKKKL